MNLYPVDKAIGFLMRIHWTVIYTVDSAIQRFNNRGLDINPNGGIVLRDTSIAFSLGFFKAKHYFDRLLLESRFSYKAHNILKENNTNIPGML